MSGKIEDALHELREMWLNFPGLSFGSLSRSTIQEMSPEQADFYEQACKVASAEPASLGAAELDALAKELIVTFVDAKNVGYYSEGVKTVLRKHLQHHPIKAPSAWRPIDEAPRDGSAFLAWDPHSRGGQGVLVMRAVPADWDFSAYDEKPEWLVEGDQKDQEQQWWGNATHWMPLPSAPVGEPKP